jgi:hypothetical protein
MASLHAAVAAKSGLDLSADVLEEAATGSENGKYMSFGGMLGSIRLSLTQCL